MLAKYSHKPLIKKFKKRKVYARFKDNTWSAELVEMGSLSSENWGVKYILYVIDVFNKYTQVKPLKNKKAKTVLYAFIEILNESKCKPIKLLVDQEREFYNNLNHQKWLTKIIF